MLLQWSSEPRINEIWGHTHHGTEGKIGRDRIRNEILREDAVIKHFLKESGHKKPMKRTRIP
jgi:hypothetical protein